MKYASQIYDILQKMTFEEKAELLTGESGMSTKGNERLGIKSKALSDGPHGARLEPDKNCTQFPNLCALAASWDIQTSEKMGNALAQDCKFHGIDMLLAPGINIKRTPLCGRNFEYLSEDPIVAGNLGAYYIKGLQGEGVACSLKHFAANNQERYRCDTSVEIDERTLREIYLKPFEIAVKNAKPESVMCSYNKVNSLWSSENPFLLTEVLRDEWGFDGFVVSDWGAVHDIVKAVSAGLDLQMPPNENITKELKASVESGDITMAEIDEAVCRVLQFALKKEVKSDSYSREKQHEIAREIAASGITLLKNDDGVLPLTKEKYKNIGVVGEFAKKPLISGQGSAEVLVDESWIDSPLDELKKLLPDCNIDYMEMYQKSTFSENMLWPEIYGEKFKSFVEKSDIILIFAGTMTSEDTEMFDRRSIFLNPAYELIAEVVAEQGKKAVLVLQNGSALTLENIKKSVSGIVEMWLGGEGAGYAVAQVLCGEVNPSGKLPETFPKDIRKDLEYPGNGKYVLYNERLDVGYRYYDQHPEEVCYPFGHGLSYTEFSYSDIKTVKTEAGYTVKFKIENTGEYDGAEVVQIYISDVDSTAKKPIKELKAFKKVFLKKGEEKEVEIVLSEEDFAYYNTMLHSWVVENGWYRILVGSSSFDIRLEDRIMYDEKMPYTIDRVGDAMIGGEDN